MASQLIFVKPELNPDQTFTNSNKWTISTPWSVGTPSKPNAIKVAGTSGLLQLTNTVLKPTKTYKWSIKVLSHSTTAGNDMYLELGGIQVQIFTPSATPLIYEGVVTLSSLTTVIINGPSVATATIAWLKIVESPTEYSIDLNDDISMPLTYNIANIKDISKRNGNYSKTITIPGSKNNNKFFSSIFEISADCTFNPNKKAEAYVITEGVEEFRGFVKLDNINRQLNGLNNYDLIDYSLTLIGGSVDLFYKLGDKLLSDLDFSEYDHTYNRTTQKNSWYTSIIKNGSPYINSVNGPNLHISSCQYHSSGRVQMNFSYPHGLVVEDWILITPTCITSTVGNPHYYAGEHMVWSVPSTTSVVLQCPFEQTTGTTFTTASSGFDMVHKHYKKGEGYVYPMIDYDQTLDEYWNTEHFYPALYIKEIIDKIFKTANYVYDSNFFNSVMFKKLILPYNNGTLKLDDSVIQSRLFCASNTNTSGNTTPNPYQINTFLLSPSYTFGNYNYHSLLTNPTPTPINVIINNDNTAGNFDNGNNFNTSTYKWTCPSNGTYSLSLEATIYFCWQYIVGVSQTDFFQPSSSNVGQLQLEVFNYTTNTVVATMTQNYAPITSNPLSNFPNSNMLNDGEAIKYMSIGADNLVLTATHQYGVRVVITALPKREFWTIIGTTNYSGNITVNYGMYGTCVFKNTIKNTNLIAGDLIKMNSMLPRNIKCADFLKSIIKMFNIYFDVSKTNNKELKLEPRDDYYSNNVIDWTSKLDLNKDLIINPMNTLKSKFYNFNYAKDNDFYGKDHQNVWTTVYGNKSYEVDNDFTTSTENVDIIFSSTILTNSTSSTYTPISRQLMKIISNMQSGTTTNSTTTPFSGNLRILYFNTASTKSKWTFHEGNDEILNIYPYAGHLDKPHLPYYDLNFDYPKGVYFTDYSWTDNNLFNVYHKKMINEITDKDAKLITCYLYLKPTDILKLDFAAIYLIDNHYLRLNKVSDYNVLNNTSTLCEFVLVKDKARFVSTTNYNPITYAPPAYNPTEFTWNNPTNPIYALESNNTNKGGNGTVSIVGYNNITNGGNIIDINGSNNTIGGNVNNILIRGNNNTIMPGLNNITLINTDNKIITTSNTTYVNGVYITNGGMLINTNINNVDAGLNKILDVFGNNKIINSVDGSLNSVFELGTNDVNNNIDALFDI